MADPTEPERQPMGRQLRRQPGRRWETEADQPGVWLIHPRPFPSVKIELRGTRVIQIPGGNVETTEQPQTTVVRGRPQ